MATVWIHYETIELLAETSGKGERLAVLLYGTSWLLMDVSLTTTVGVDRPTITPSVSVCEERRPSSPIMWRNTHVRPPRFPSGAPDAVTSGGLEVAPPDVSME